MSHEALSFTNSQRDAATRALTALEQQAKEAIAAIRTARDNVAATQKRCDAVAASLREAQQAVQAEHDALASLADGKSAMLASAAGEVHSALPKATADFIGLDAEAIIAAVRDTDPAALEAKLESARFGLQSASRMRDPAHRERVREALARFVV